MKAIPTLLAAQCILAGGIIAAELPVFFRVSFDGNADAELSGERVVPSSASQASYVGSDHGKALHLTKDGTIEYDVGEGFPCHAGSIEIRFKPAFPQRPDQVARTIMTFAPDKGAGLNFGFEPQGTRWSFGTLHPKWQRKMSASNFSEANEQRWNHLLLTWDDRTSPAVLKLYRDGKWDRHRTENLAQSFEGVRKLTIGGTGDQHTLIDELVIYREALTESDVTFLHGAIGKGDRFAALMQKREEAARAATAAKEARRAQIAKLQGRVAQIINPRGGKQRDFKLPGGIVATGLRVEDVGKVDLSRFAVIHGPPGAGYQLTKEQDEVMRQYVRSGGGYVGVCAGANYAGRAKLLNMTTHSFKNQGLLTIGIKPHPITDGFTGEMVIHHGNGPIMVPGEGCDVAGTFQIGQGFPITTAAIVAGQSGKGRVVAFGPHPMGGAVEHQTQGAKFSGQELGTDELLVNALLWAAGVTGAE